MNKKEIEKAKADVTKKIIKERNEMDNLLNCRAGKLLRKGTPFIVVSIKEDYYPAVYRMIRHSEKRKKTWTEGDEISFNSAMNYWFGI